MMTVEYPLSAGWRSHPRYPDPQSRFWTSASPCRIFNAAVERLAHRLPLG